MNDSLDKKIHHRNAVARAHSQAVRGQTPTLMVKEAPAYSGRWREILPIVLMNLVLTFLTVGIYRFWAKTRIRRYFVSRASFLNDPLEYTGTGLELFIGFLIVLAILVPVSVGSGMLQQFLVTPGTDPMSILTFQLAYMFAFYFLFNVAVYRAQRYRLSRINWRGIRGGQEGSALRYALYALGLGVLNLGTVFLLYPLMRRVLIGYRLNNASFGTEKIHFFGGMAKLFVAWLLPWLMMIGLFALLGFASWEIGTHAHQTGTSPDQIAKDIAALAGPVTYSLVAVALLLPFTFIWYRAVEIRYWINNSGFDRLVFESRLKSIHLLGPYTVYITLLVLIVGTAVYAAGLILPENIAVAREYSGGFFLQGLVGFIALILVGGLLQPMIIQNLVLANLCRTLTIQGSFSPDALFQSQLEIPRSGEGLADALDVDAF